MESRRSFSAIALLTAAAFFVVPVVAVQAHGDHSGASGLAHGFAHPMTGPDHILAMVGVGLLAAKMGGRSLWTLPLAFLSAMIVGGAAGMAHLPMIGVEHGILASILVLGCLVAMATPVRLRVATPLVASAALFHGFAHGLEAPSAVSGLTYGAGFAASTLVLLVLGVSLGLLVQRSMPTTRVTAAYRVAGIGVLLGGVAMMFGMA